MIDQVFGEVIALLRAIRGRDETIIFDQVRIPLIRFAAEKAVEAIEPFLQRPLFAGGARSDILLGDVVILPEPESAPTAILQDLPDGCRLVGKTPVRAGKTAGCLGDRSHAVQVVVAS